MATKLNDPTKRAIARASDYRNVFGSGQGRRVLLDMMKEHHIMSPTIGAKVDSHDLAFNEGARNVVLRILKLMKTDVDKLENLMEEAADVNSTLY